MNHLIFPFNDYYKSETLMNKEDRDAAAVVQTQFEKESIHIHAGCNTVRVDKDGDTKRVTIECGDQQQTLEVDEILVAVGRTPNTAGWAWKRLV